MFWLVYQELNGEHGHQIQELYLGKRHSMQKSKFVMFELFEKESK